MTMKPGETESAPHSVTSHRGAHPGEGPAEEDAARAKQSLVDMGYLSPAHLESAEIWGDGPVAAMERFQRDHNLNPTGQIDGELDTLLRCASLARSVQGVDTE